MPKAPTKAPTKAPAVKKTATKKPVAVKKTVAKKKATSKTKPTKTKSAKDLATERGEPYVTVLSVDIDPNDVQNGAFELDWNDKFVANLIRAGYQKDPKDSDADIVDRWFTAVCRNVVLETYEQYEAMNPQRLIKSRDIGDGMSEVS
jgi:hypothetical protein